MTMRTPLGRVRGLGSAKDGTEHFWSQRITALALVPLTILFVIIIVATSGTGYEAVRETIGFPITAIFILMFVLTGIYHMKLGMQVIIEDYVHHEGIKVLALIGNVFFAAFIALACILAVLKISFGS